jgi:Flp pilus assembly protein TadG
MSINARTTEISEVNMQRILNRKGQSIVELALITPLVLVALYVPFDFGVTIYTGQLTQNAVRDGARKVATTDVLTGSLLTTLATNIHGTLPAYLGSKQVTVNYYGSTTGCAQSVEVTATGTYNFFWYRLIGLIGLAPPNSMQITRTTKLRYEFQPDTNGGTGSTVNACTTVTATGTHS